MTLAPVGPIESHAAHSERMLAHAEAMLDAGDRLQASEKIWGAAAHALKAIADRRSWPYAHHADGRVIAAHIGKQAGNREIAPLFKSIEGMHVNFYDDTYSLEAIRDGLDEAKRLLAMLTDADAAIPEGAAMPDDREYRRRAERSPGKRRLPSE